MAVEAGDPLLRSAEIALASGLMDADEVLGLYEFTRVKCFAAAEEADRRPKLTSLAQVIAPLAPYTPAKVAEEARRFDYAEKRLAVFGGEAKLPENQPPRHLSILINNALHDSAGAGSTAVQRGRQQKGSVTRSGGCRSRSRARVFNTLLDERSSSGWPGVSPTWAAAAARDQYLAYFHNACDQIRGRPVRCGSSRTTSTATRW
jgi:2-oxoisovalerate dehydrogenase E1 component